MAAHYTLAENLSEDELIIGYFSLGFRHQSIQTFLAECHNVDMSIRTLRRRLAILDLKRHNVMNCSEESLRSAIRSELARSRGTIGYRQIWHNLRVKHHITVPRRKVGTSYGT